MISTIAELLHGFIEAERTRLDQFHLSHGPTIGLMYEGLTSEVLNRAIPKELGLSVASGFITDDSGNLSPQIDCMLVSGNGEPIPYTNFCKWHIKDVVAVLEIKKTLYSSELAESYDTLRAVLDNQRRYVRLGTSSRTYDISSALRAFSEITGTIAPERSKVQSLPFDEEILYHALICERISPVRIALGYDGFQSEYSLRESLAKFVGKTLMKRGFGATSYPQLIISGQYSLAKMNGQPYSPPRDKGDWWNFLASSSANPVKLILEFIWTRLSRDYDLGGLWGEDLEIEEFHPCLKAKGVKNDEVVGWEYEYIYLDRDAFREASPSNPWQPVVVNQAQFVIFNSLCVGEKENRRDPAFIKHIEESGYRVDDFIADLQATGLVALDGDNLCLITEQCKCAILPDGRYVVAEDNSGRLTRWLEQYMNARKA